ncbi:MAG TPA: hypothetical protein EYG16_09845, partial [Deltaproteobacteria bacterium]|nr:hypothetical protein [Deltaproteobacteria bacterium]
MLIRIRHDQGERTAVGLPFIFSVLVFTVATAFWPVAAPASSGRASADLSHGESRASVLAMAFEVNSGQVPGRDGFLSRGRDHGLFLDQAGAMLVLANGDGISGQAVMLTLDGALEVKPTGELPLQGTAAWFKGDDPDRWISSVQRYERVRYPDLRPGVDMLYYANEGRLEYDFILAPGVDPGQLSFRLSGLAGDQPGLLLSENGDLWVELGGGRMLLRRPIAWQHDEVGSRQLVDSAFVLNGDGGVGFKLAAWDHDRELIIDPVLEYSSFLGGDLGDEAYDVAVGPTGDLYVAGKTISADFIPVPACADCAASSTVPLAHDAFVARIDPSLTGAASLVYATYLGGGDTDWGLGIAV